ncbi:hypothetical protein [Sphingobacterium sp.]|uniref:hypothetical protein n=1 Tax=Sphingobacterium sp. TaxID=341027 RepID=UPI0028A1B6D3|nr:hypothetical protein [Sphingobacterium sp.]
MAYNKKNQLIIAKKVQDIYLKHSKEGVTTRSIYNEHIYPVFFISIATFYKYLAINARKELKEIGVSEEDINSCNDPVERNDNALVEQISAIVKEQLDASNKHLLRMFAQMQGL